MPLQSSGQISAENINGELGVSVTSQLSLNGASARGLSGQASGDVKMSEFYSRAKNTLSFYVHRYGATIGTLYVKLYDGTTETTIATITGQNNSWVQFSGYVDYITAPYRVVFHYLSGNSFTGDIALDTIVINGTTYNFDSTNDGFETSTTGTSAIATAFSEKVTVPTSTTARRWNRRTGSTPSASTGPTSAQSGSYYVYAETSSYNNTNFWLFSPEIS